MNTLPTPRKLHPLQWIALVSVTLLSLAGIGAITGLIPSSKSTEAPLQPAATGPSVEPRTAIAATPPLTATESGAAAAKVQATEAAAPPQPKPVKRSTPVVRETHTAIARNETAERPSAPPEPAVCENCGRIESIQRIEREGDGSGLGAAAGGVVGGVLGNNVGRGNGRTVATIAGVVGGALLGNKIEKTQKKTVSFQTTVRLDDGTTRVFDTATERGLYEGERVRIVNGAIEPE